MTGMNLLLSSAVTVSIAAAGLAAQTASTTSTKPSVVAPSNPTTLTGCVERADQLKTPNQTTTVDSQNFVLVRAQPSSEKATAPATPTGTAGSLGPMYRLVADREKINPHVGHKVEITGTVEPAAAGAGAPSTDPSPSTSPSLTVQSIKMVSETCAR